MTSAMSSQSTKRQAAENDRVGARRPYICLPPNGRFAPEPAIRPCPQLTPSDRARFTKRRKEAYEALHPETRHGANQHTRGVAKSATPSFSEDQATLTGAAERTVRLDAERGEKVCDAALDLIRGTKFDTGVYLDKLKAMPADEQVATIKADLATPSTAACEATLHYTAYPPLV